MARANPWDKRRIALQEALRELREEAGMKQVDVAKKLKKHQSYVSKYETGERRLDLIELEQIALALGLDLPALVSRYQAT